MVSTASRPNLLFVMTDQQRFDAMSCHGGQAQTPHLDALAAGGVDLRRHYSQAPVCVPSRSTIFTGRYPHAHRVMENNVRLAPHEVHLFKPLRQAGYWIAYNGKNHLLPPAELAANLDRFFDPESIAPTSPAMAAHRQLEHEADERLRTIGSYASAMFHDSPDEVTTTGMITDHSLASLEAAPTDSPWCIVTSFYDPHVPHLAPRRFQSKYPLESIRLPETPANPFAEKPARMRVKHFAQGSDRATDAEKRHYLSVYYSMCSFVDEQIGRILTALKSRPDADRTIVVFISDHGDFAWHHGMCKKDLVLYEDLLHVPTIVAWPGQFAPRVVDRTFTEHTDLVPTLLELAGVTVPFGCQGRSFAPLLRGETEIHRDTVHAEVCFPWMRNPYPTYEDFHNAWKAAQASGSPLGRAAPYNVPGDYTKGLRTAEWSYNWYGDGFEELYSLHDDPEEWHNRAADPACDTVLREFREKMLHWILHTADPRNPRVEAEQVREFDRWHNSGS